MRRKRSGQEPIFWLSHILYMHSIMRRRRWPISIIICFFLLICPSNASLGDRLPEFKDCLITCKEANCENGYTSIPLHRRLLLWDCASECDYTCQHVVTKTRLHREYPYRNPVLQFHGKWPFYRFLGMQEPFSVLFSLFNYLAHIYGLGKVREKIPVSYPLRRYYILFGLFGCFSWIASMIFHARDFQITERLDYFAAGASVLYGLYCAPIRIFRLDDPLGNQPYKGSLLRIWTLTCVCLYIAHVSYLSFWSWDYTYNMAANVAVGTVQNVLWTGFSYVRYRKSGRSWQAWPGMIVAWIVLAMSLEILDFVPWRGMIDAHSLWHAGTIGPTIWWYSFLIRDAQEDLQSMRLKA